MRLGHPDTDPTRLNIGVIGTRGLRSDYSGIETASAHLYQRLAADGHRIVVFTPKNQPTQPAIHPNIEEVPSGGLQGRSLFTLSHLGLAAASAIRRSDLDVVETHAEAAGLVIPFIDRAGLPTVSRVHGLDWARAKWGRTAKALLKHGERSLVKHATEISVVSQDLVSYFSIEYGRAVFYVPNGVSAAVAPPDGLLTSLGVEPHRYVLSVGRIVPEKRVLDIVSAFRDVDTTQQLLLVGGAENSTAYGAEVQRLARADARVKIAGFVARGRLPQVYANASAFVQASELERLPMALLEALAAGAPILVSSIPPHEEIVGTEHMDAIAFRLGDVERLTRLIQGALDRPEAHRRRADTIRTRVLRLYSWDGVARATEAGLRRAIAQHRAKRA